jgi:hypothetical protein
MLGFGQGDTVMTAGCEAVIRRLSTDENFRTEFQTDRSATLAGFELSGEERADLLGFDLSALENDKVARRRASTVCAMKGGLS